jgi:hypothetical protein
MLQLDEKPPRIAIANVGEEEGSDIDDLANMLEADLEADVEGQDDSEGEDSMRQPQPHGAACLHSSPPPPPPLPPPPPPPLPNQSAPSLTQPGGEREIHAKWPLSTSMEPSEGGACVTLPTPPVREKGEAGVQNSTGVSQQRIQKPPESQGAAATAGGAGQKPPRFASTAGKIAGGFAGRPPKKGEGTSTSGSQKAEGFAVDPTALHKAKGKAVPGCVAADPLQEGVPPGWKGWEIEKRTRTHKGQKLYQVKILVTLGGPDRISVRIRSVC